MTMESNPQQWQVGLIGYGEVGKILAEDLRAQGVAVAAYDIKLQAHRASRCARMRRAMA